MKMSLMGDIIIRVVHLNVVKLENEGRHQKDDWQQGLGDHN